MWVIKNLVDNFKIMWVIVTLIFLGNFEDRVKVPKLSKPTFLNINIETTVNSSKSFQQEKTAVGV